MNRKSFTRRHKDTKEIQARKIGGAFRCISILSAFVPSCEIISELIYGIQ